MRCSSDFSRPRTFFWNFVTFATLLIIFNIFHFEPFVIIWIIYKICNKFQHSLSFCSNSLHSFDVILYKNIHIWHFTNMLFLCRLGRGLHYSIHFSKEKGYIINRCAMLYPLLSNLSLRHLSLFYCGKRWYLDLFSFSHPKTRLSHQVFKTGKSKNWKYQ